MAIHDDIRIQSAQHYIDRFENSFEDYVDELAGIVATANPELLRPAVQALINAYHELGKEISPIYIPHFNTLMMFVKITGARLEHSGENENLTILRSSIPSE